MFKRLSWNWTKKMISSDKLWYLWQGYNYIIKENELLNLDIKNSVSLRIGFEKSLTKIAADGIKAKEQSLVEKDPT